MAMSIFQILIDHNTDSGFKCIAEAREYLLNVGRKEFADPVTEKWDVRGSHVVAPVRHQPITSLLAFMIP
jgi:ribosomal protein RSM22 (predicted rRNA methylase)